MESTKTTLEQQVAELNPTGSEAVAAFLKNFITAKYGECYKALQLKAVYVVEKLPADAPAGIDAEYVEGLEDCMERYLTAFETFTQNEKQYQTAIELLKSDLKTVMATTRQLYIIAEPFIQNLGAVLEESKQVQKPSLLARGIAKAMTVTGQIKDKNSALAIAIAVERVLMSIKDRGELLKASFQEIDFQSTLSILVKHRVIPAGPGQKTLSSPTTSDNEQ